MAFDIEKRRASWRRYNKSPKRPDRAWNYRQSAKGREAKLRYVTSPKGQETAWQYAHSFASEAQGDRHTPEARKRERETRRTRARESHFRLMIVPPGGIGLYAANRVGSST